MNNRYNQGTYLVDKEPDDIAKFANRFLANCLSAHCGKYEGDRPAKKNRAIGNGQDDRGFIWQIPARGPFHQLASIRVMSYPGVRHLQANTFRILGTPRNQPPIPRPPSAIHHGNPCLTPVLSFNPHARLLPS
ncbi:hypothetical protein CSAL01_05927 [Colletotrichum salicis]|uniref:Uncharacterized protein n=1 Tax=Colletotrichum salicis TaxID=1209931 RepID=A0A135SAX9_9PEZI|nr:hypothetical protein CSAL01_05927 [Colletotrichum salicis]